MKWVVLQLTRQAANFLDFHVWGPFENTDKAEEWAARTLGEENDLCLIKRLWSPEDYPTTKPTTP
jgi:hypothetical protein